MSSSSRVLGSIIHLYLCMKIRKGQGLTKRSEFITDWKQIENREGGQIKHVKY